MLSLFVCLLLFFHLSQEEVNGGGKSDGGISEHPEKMGKDAGKVACKGFFFGFDCVNEGQRIGNFLKRTADKR